MGKNDIISIFVGVPENDKEVSVSKNQTVAQVLEDNNITVAGLVQHNGKTLNPSELNQTLNELGFTDGDSLYIMKKMDSAN